MSEILEEPTKRLVEHYLGKFRDSNRYFLADQAITKLFATFPTNKSLDDVLLKVTVLNDLYSTRIYATFEIARHICSLDIDPHLAMKSMDIVDRIAAARFNGKARNVFSFASKYCSWHDKENYPLYDAFVEKLLMAYQRKDHFATFKKVDLRKYGPYKNAVSAFRDYYSLVDYSFKELDKFLWLYGKDLFPKEFKIGKGPTTQ